MKLTFIMDFFPSFLAFIMTTHDIDGDASISLKVVGSEWASKRAQFPLPQSLKEYFSS